jgi:hypothetical protein
MNSKAGEKSNIAPDCVEAKVGRHTFSGSPAAFNAQNDA